MKRHVLILGAGFGGLELATRLSETLQDAVRVTLLDRNDSFVFGYSKLDVCSVGDLPAKCGCTTATSPRTAWSSARRR